MANGVPGMTLSSQTKEYVYVDVEDVLEGNDPTASPISFAFVQGDTEPDSWASGSWVTVNGAYKARSLIDLAKGTYKVWVKLDVSPESVVRMVGTIRIT